MCQEGPQGGRPVGQECKGNQEKLGCLWWNRRISQPNSRSLMFSLTLTLQAKGDGWIAIFEPELPSCSPQGLIFSSSLIFLRDGPILWPMYKCSIFSLAPKPGSWAASQVWVAAISHLLPERGSILLERHIFPFSLISYPFICWLSVVAQISKFSSLSWHQDDSTLKFSSGCLPPVINANVPQPLRILKGLL